MQQLVVVDLQPAVRQP